MVPAAARFPDLIDRYDGFLFDAYGVLNEAHHVCPGAPEALAAVRAAGKPLLVVTNDASKRPSTMVARFTRLGLDVREPEVVSSGQLVAGWIAARGLAGKRAIVLGTDDARGYVRDAGVTVLEPDDAAEIDALLTCDDAGFAFLPGLNASLTACVRALDAGRPLALCCPNPDLVYPRGEGKLGFTAGAMATILEAALLRRHPTAPRFEHLGKPHPAIFAEARRRLPGVTRLLMIGDQLETDIAGARAAGLDAALVTGVSVWRDGATPPERAPHWLLEGLG